MAGLKLLVRMPYPSGSGEIDGLTDVSAVHSSCHAERYGSIVETLAKI